MDDIGRVTPDNDSLDAATLAAAKGVLRGRPRAVRRKCEVKAPRPRCEEDEDDNDDDDAGLSSRA